MRSANHRFRACAPDSPAAMLQHDGVARCFGYSCWVSAADAPRDSVPAGPPQDQRDLYQIAYQLGLRTLEDQRDELNGIRTRGGSFMAFVGSATAFLVGTSIQAASRDGLFYVIAVAATLCSTLALISLLALLRPKPFEFRLSPGVLVDRWIEASVPRPSLDAFLRGLADLLEQMQGANEGLLRELRRRYVVLVGSGTLGLIAWTLLVWSYA